MKITQLRNATIIVSHDVERLSVRSRHST